MRTLVTGANGLIGRPLLDVLVRAGHEVHGVSRAPQAGDSVHWHRADLLDTRQAIAVVEAVRPTHLVHLAWETSHGEFWAAPSNDRWLCASMALVRAFTQTGGQRFLGVGSCAEYDWMQLPDDGRCFEQQTPIKPATAYGAAKAAFWTWAHQHCASADVSAAWARLFHMFGPGEPPSRLVPSVIVKLLAGRPAACSDGSQWRDFAHTHDIAELLAALLGSDGTGAFNLGSGQAVQIADVVNAIGELVGRPELVQLGALPRAAGDPDYLLPSIDALNEQVAYRCPPIRERLAATIDYHRAQLA